MHKINGQIIRFTNEFGAIEHYYHYFTAMILPLVYLIETEQPEENIYVRGCKQLDHLLHELNLPNVHILDKDFHKDIFEKNFPRKHELVASGKYKIANITRRKIQGYALPKNYNNIVFNIVINALTKKYLSSSISLAKRNIDIQLKNIGESTNKTVLMIERLSGGEKYLGKNKVGQNGAGSDRRSIPNYDELYYAVSNIGDVNVIRTELWDKTLAEQFVLFNSADIVICQHGASLINTVFCKPFCNVIEIFPIGIQQYLIDHAHFYNMAKCMNLYYHSVIQDDLHAPVDVNIIKQRVNEIINGQN
jgi:hypothetical protein